MKVFADPEAERDLLGALLVLSNGSAGPVIGRLQHADFREREHQAIFVALQALADRQAPFDQLTVKAELERTGAIAELKLGPVLLHDLVAGVPVPESAGFYADRVLELSRRRAMQRDLTDMAEANERGDDLGIARGFLSLQEALEAPSSGDRFQPLDWVTLLREGLPAIEYLRAPYIVAGARHTIVGPAESSKSIWALWLNALLTRDGRTVAYFSQENPRAEDLRRLEKLAPEPGRLVFFHDAGLDLADREHVANLLHMAEAGGWSMITFDSLSACWSGDENENREIAELDRKVFWPITQRTGAATLVVDHTGHPQQWVSRRGAGAGRGASSKGQKADVVLEFRGGTGPSEFTIVHGKARIGGRRVPDATCRVVDTDDGGLDIVQSKSPEEQDAERLADRAVEVIGAEDGPMTTTRLRAALGGGKALQERVLEILRAENGARVVVREELVSTGRGGRQRARVWRLAEDNLGL